MSAMNQHMLNHVRSQGRCRIRTFDLAPSFAAGWFPGQRWLIAKFLHYLFLLLRFSLYSLFRAPSKPSLYFSISGGRGKWFEIPFLAVAHLCYREVYIHHHSFAYCNKTHLSMALASRVCPNQTVHIALSEHMKSSLVERYGIPPDRVLILSNVALCEKFPSAGRREGLHTLGFFGNISPEKGIHEFLETYRTLIASDPQLRAIIGGPCLTPEVSHLISTATTQYPLLEYRGPVYGPDKERFFSEIDVLLFPSKHTDEAEPVTLYEAISSGVPIIAWDQGCIREILAHGFGETVEPAADFPKAATQFVQTWRSDGVSFERLRQQLIVNFSRLLLEQQAALAMFVATLLSEPFP